MFQLISNLLPSRNDRLLKKYWKVVNEINALEEQYKGIDDSELLSKKDQLKAHLSQGQSLNSLLPEAFAAVREAASRALNMRHFDVQLIGGMVLHDGKIAEMRTGEGKTFVAPLAAYLNALTEQSVHIVTVNDYLARRDSEWMGSVYKKLGLSVGVVVSGQSHEERVAAYQADITYGTNNEFGFDYLRDNMVYEASRRVQRGHYFAVVDEVDSILIDEARTPLIISGPTDESSDVYYQVDKLVQRLKPSLGSSGEGDYTVDEKSRVALLTETGHQHIEEALIKAGLLREDQSLYDLNNVNLLHHVGASLRAHSLFKKNVDYLVRNGKVLIVDEFTGRVMAGRRWGDGLHQAVEAKEGVRIERENQTLASITFQNYFRLYQKLSGMTGTADTEAQEFQDIYGLEVAVIPTHVSMVREDEPDAVYMSEREKFEAILADIHSSVEIGQPTLIGTASIAVSEHLSKMMTKAKIKHQVLNAKHHEAESKIIAQAGRPRAVTIATNMAGRGTDIVLGGSLEAELAEADESKHEAIRDDWQVRHQQVLESGGLRVIGTERHESRRVDNQLRGRSGRQGDPGSSRFYLSLDDSLMRIFAGDKVQSLIEKLGMQESEAIEHPWMNRAIENAQRKVESHNFDIRKNLLEYDDVANEQRQVVYKQRNELMETEQVHEQIVDILSEVGESVVERYVPDGHLEERWDVQALEQNLAKEFGLQLALNDWVSKQADISASAIREKVCDAMHETYQAKEDIFGNEALYRIEVVFMMRVLDNHWKEHLANMDHLRQGIGLRSFAQKNPKQEYKREAFRMFELMLDTVRYNLASALMRLVKEPEFQLTQASERNAIDYRHKQPKSILSPPLSAPDTRLKSDSPPDVMQRQPQPGGQSFKPSTVRRTHKKLGRNEPCFCGSGKKYKHCCYGKAK
ncbi:MAG: preprotein translocase subunit SecA [Chromatiales bacterium]|nr:preprotein translocase subunit SecA [Chromatiales bacterium]